MRFLSLIWNGLRGNVGNLRATMTPSFLRLVTAMFVMNLGSSITVVALPILVVQRYGFGSELAVTVAIRLVPTILAGGVAVWILSRFDARWVAAISIVAAGLTTLVIPLTTELWQLNILSVLNGVAAVGAGPAMMALRSSTVPADRVMSGNGLIVFAERAPQVLGPLVAAVVLAIASVETLFVAEAVAMIAAAVLLTKLKKVALEPDGRFFSRENARKWLTIVRQPRVQGYVITGLFYTVAVSAMRMILVALATFAFPDNPSALPLLLGSMALGAVVGGLIGAGLPVRWIGPIYVLGNVIEAIALVGVGLSASLALSMTLLVLGGVFESLATTAFFADVQRLIPGSSIGPFFALYMPGIDSAAVVGTMVGPALVAGGPLVGTVVVAALIAVPFFPYLRAFLRSTPDVESAAGVENV